MKNLSSFNSGLFNFLDNSPTPYHAVAEMLSLLDEAGFTRLHEKDKWSLELGQSYYLTRNDSSLVAFHYGNKDWGTQTSRFWGAHSDSPCLKVKPNAVVKQNGYVKLGVEVYGGVLLNSWFDRDLGLAGRVHFVNSKGHLKSTLIDFKRAVAMVPSLAIHLDREANKNRTINPQKDIQPILFQERSGDEKLDFEAILLEQINQQDSCHDAATITDFELSFYDVQKAALVGFKNEFICSARLDNLLSCYVGLRALATNVQANAMQAQNAFLVINDHEEVGSQTAAGAQGGFLKSVLTRMTGEHEDLARSMAQSMFISADNAHGIHPNFPEKHDAAHGPVLNDGLVIKLNANQRYATNSTTSACFRQLCQQAEVKVQNFVMRSDMACGSTIGPMSSADLGIQTIDIGVPTFGMHSTRETAGFKDAYEMYQVAGLFYASPLELIP